MCAIPWRLFGRKGMVWCCMPLRLVRRRFLTLCIRGIFGGCRTAHAVCSRKWMGGVVGLADRVGGTVYFSCGWKLGMTFPVYYRYSTSLDFREYMKSIAELEWNTYSTWNWSMLRPCSKYQSMSKVQALAFFAFCIMMSRIYSETFTNSRN